MTSPALFSRVVLARIGLTTIFMLPIFGVWVNYERSQERAATQAALDQKQEQIDAAQAKLDKEIHDEAVTRRGLVVLSNRVKLTSCQESNRRAKVAIEEAFKRDAELGKAAVTVGVTREAALAFIAADMRLVIRANPTIDCSPAAIGLQPLPPIPPAVTGPSPPPGGTATTIPLARRAGTTTRPPPPSTSTPRHGRRRPPHPPHP